MLNMCKVFWKLVFFNKSHKVIHEEWDAIALPSDHGEDTLTTWLKDQTSSQVASSLPHTNRNAIEQLLARIAWNVLKYKKEIYLSKKKKSKKWKYLDVNKQLEEMSKIEKGA